MPKKLTTEEFKIKLSTQHPNLELLSKYDGNRKSVDVRCKIHDYTYKTSPKRLMAGCGCQKCYNDRRGDTLRKTTEQFILESKKYHGDKYDYSKVNYVNSITKVCIICPKHGEFFQTPNKHIHGQGCPKCVGKNKTTDSVIKEFQAVHGDKYDYSEVSYVNNTTKVTIICHKHGRFFQTPDKHLQKEGCPICNESKLELLVRDFLLKNNISFESQKRFNWLGRQSLDFYLPEFNIGIECQGEQHFVERHGIFLLKSRLFDIIKRDTLKKNICDANNLTLLYVMDKRWVEKCTSKEFNCIYNETNIITCEHLFSINEKIEKLSKLLS